VILSTESWRPPALDEAVSAVLLARADAGDGGTLRLFVPARAVVFGRQDSTRPGFARAVAAAADAGFAPVMRLSGGRAAVFHEGTIAVSLSVPEANPRDTITARFQAAAGAVVVALGALGVTAAVGEVPGEYCPGAYSVHVGRRKVAGLGQRLGRHAAHIGGVVVVEGADLVNRVLEPVYRHLDYAWDPEATGAISEHHPATVDELISALADAFAERWRPLRAGTIDPSWVATARAIAANHVAG
jgi:octanoyl-[GcvH]:protein N-octanoyltransferase